MTADNKVKNLRKREKLKMLYISSSPPTRFSSGYLVAKQGGASPLLDKLSQVYNIQSFGWERRRELRISSKHVYLLDGFQIFVNLVSTLLKGRFDVIVTTGIPVLESIPTFFFAKFLRIPIVIKETHWYWPNTHISALTWPINKFMVSKATLVVCPGIRAWMYWRKVGIPKKKIKIVHFYASMLQINPQIVEFAEKLRAQFRNKIVILYFGRLIKKKGVDYLIMAFAKLQKGFKNVALVISGDGPERGSLEKKCGEMGLNNVYFTGAVDEKIKPGYFMLADIYVYPSITLQLPEEWPLGVVEAMSVGKPVIVTTSVGSAPDVVKHGFNGFVVPEKDPDALYNAISKLIEDKKLRKKMGTMSKKIVDGAFTYDQVVQALDEALDRFISEKSEEERVQ